MEKALTIVACALALLCGASALPNIAPNAQNCGNGIFCAHSQTCMSNATGAGLLFACSPLPNAVRCNDARWSCPASSTCSDDDSALGSSKCVASDGSVVDAVVNVDPLEVAEMRDFGEGMQPANVNSMCGVITSLFQLPNFCRCAAERRGGTLTCTTSIGGVSLGASAWIRPCASPASIGYSAWVNLNGRRLAGVGQEWRASFQVNVPIPHANVNIGIAGAGARAEFSAQVNNMVITTRLALGACGNVWRFERCNPTSHLPVPLLRGPTFNFSNLCR